MLNKLWNYKFKDIDVEIIGSTLKKLLYQFDHHISCKEKEGTCNIIPVLRDRSQLIPGTA